MSGHSKEERGIDASAPVREPSPPFAAQSQEGTGLESALSPLPRWRGERYRAAAKLSGMAALVTGGDSGIGRSVAYHFAREGADVAITFLPSERSDAEEVAEAIGTLGRSCELIEGDLREESFCREAVERMFERFGRLDVLVHNAAHQNRKRIESLSEAELDSTMKTNVYAYLRLVREAKPRMKPGGSIIATGSIVGLEGSARLSDYGATKGAVHSITRCLAAELLSDGIRVNCVAPGPVWTPLNPSDSGVEAEEISEFGREMGSSAMGRPAQPEEIAPAFVYFASNADSSFVTGVVLPITGSPA